MIINPGRGFRGNYGTQAVGPALDYLLAGFNVQSNTSKEVYLEDFKQLIIALRVHAVASAIEVLHKPKPEYSPDQSLEELFTMWSNSFWETAGQCLEDEEYYNNQLRKIPEDFLHKFLEFVYIVRTDAVNKMIQAVEEKSATKTLDGFLQELITIGNPE
jgi:hypothetical protein